MEQIKSGSKEPLMMSGPKFGEANGWWSKFKNWLIRNGQRIVIVIILALIIAGGIYLFSKNPQPAEIANLGDQTPTEQQSQSESVSPNQINVPTNSQKQTDKTATATAASPKAELIKMENNQITVKANKGAGVTHLAREALKQYLEKNPDLKQNIKPEHKIYIEDYLKDKTGKTHITVGKELNFDENTIKEAIDKAQKLTDNQIKNLHKYVLLVPSLST